MTHDLRRTYPALRVILAATQALDDVALAIRDVSRRIDMIEHAGPAAQPQSEKLLDLASRILSDQDNLSRYASRISTTPGELTIIKVPAEIHPLLIHYLHDTLSPKLIEMVAAKWPDARSELQPDLSEALNISGFLNGAT